jgi:hypothetical protein
MIMSYFRQLLHHQLFFFQTRHRHHLQGAGLLQGYLHNFGSLPTVKIV